MSDCTTYVGLDVHKESIVAALLVPSTGEVKRAEFGGDAKAQRKLERWLQREAVGELRCCYEAGPCGYELQRRLTAAGVACQVVAPSLIWRQPGQRQKNDRRDALKLAQQLAAGMLTEVHPPTLAEEAVRALVRCREDAKVALHRVKQHILKYLGQQGVRHEGRAWTDSHRRWLRGLRLADPVAQTVLEDYLLTLQQAEQRLQRLDAQVSEQAEREELREAVGLLRCFRGVDTLTAMVFVTELYSFGRFASPRGLMAYLGLVPGEHSSGERERGTGLTKTGNGLVRRVLVESAWQYGRKPQVSGALAKRQAGQPPAAIALAQKAMTRLHQRYWRLIAKGKEKSEANAAVARELVGFLWAAMQLRSQPAAA